MRRVIKQDSKRIVKHVIQCIITHDTKRVAQHVITCVVEHDVNVL